MASGSSAYANINEARSLSRTAAANRGTSAASYFGLANVEAPF